MRLWLAPFALILLPSCATYGHHRHYAGHGGAGTAIAVIELFSAVAQLAAASEARESVVVVEAAPPPEPPEPPPAPTPPLVHAATPTRVVTTHTATPGAPSPSDAPRVDATAARAALSSRDVGACAPRGVPHGYGHATVVFAPDGTPASVTVDAPAGVSSDGLVCLGEELGRARIPRFAGGAVSVGTTWFVP